MTVWCSFVLGILGASCISAVAWKEPSLVLHNAAEPGMRMPASGLGTAFTNCTHLRDRTAALEPSLKWLSIGGRRFDGAHSYGCDWSIGRAIKQAGIARSDVFITSKIGPGGIPYPIGYKDTSKQTDAILNDLNSTYIDLLLVHEPFSYYQFPADAKRAPSSDPLCNLDSQAYDEAGCRISTWKAMVEAWKSGKARAIGVSNYNSTHLQEIIDAGLPLPAVNQIQFSPTHGVHYPSCNCGGSCSRSTATCDLPGQVNETCKKLMEVNEKLNITTNAYSSYNLRDGSGDIFLPEIVSIAKAHNVSAAQVILNYQWALGATVNPQSDKKSHMIEGLFFHDFELTTEEMHIISSMSLPSRYRHMLV